MTPLAKRFVERMAERQGIKSIKFRNRKRELVLPPIDIIPVEERSDEESIPELLTPEYDESDSSDDESESESESGGSDDEDIPQLLHQSNENNDLDLDDESDEEDESRFGEALDNEEPLGAIVN